MMKEQTKKKEIFLEHLDLKKMNAIRNIDLPLLQKIIEENSYFKVRNLCEAD